MKLFPVVVAIVLLIVIGLLAVAACKVEVAQKEATVQPPSVESQPDHRLVISDDITLNTWTAVSVVSDRGTGREFIVVRTANAVAIKPISGACQ